jgi:2-keto-4-pentenoate hydratase
MHRQVKTGTATIAASFVAARHAGTALPVYPGTAPRSPAEAYAIQDAAIALQGGAIGGWKIGRIHPPLSEKFGTTRLIGPALTSQVRQLDERATGYRIPDGFGAVEAEVMLRVGTRVDPTARDWTPDQALGLIDAAHVGFEIASSPYPGINTDGPLVTISDQGNNHGLLIGPPIPDWPRCDLDTIAVTMRIDGALVGSGTPAAFPGGIGGSLLALLENLASRGIALEPGAWISTGAITGVHEVVAGQYAEAEFVGVGTIHCTIANQPQS